MEIVYFETKENAEKHMENMLKKHHWEICRDFGCNCKCYNVVRLNQKWTICFHNEYAVENGHDTYSYLKEDGMFDSIN